MTQTLQWKNQARDAADKCTIVAIDDLFGVFSAKLDDPGLDPEEAQRSFNAFIAEFATDESKIPARWDRSVSVIEQAKSFAKTNAPDAQITHTTRFQIHSEGAANLFVTTNLVVDTLEGTVSEKSDFVSAPIKVNPANPDQLAPFNPITNFVSVEPSTPGDNTTVDERAVTMGRERIMAVGPSYSLNPNEVTEEQRKLRAYASTLNVQQRHQLLSNLNEEQHRTLERSLTEEQRRWFYDTSERNAAGQVERPSFQRGDLAAVMRGESKRPDAVDAYVDSLRSFSGETESQRNFGNDPSGNPRDLATRATDAAPGGRYAAGAPLTGESSTSETSADQPNAESHHPTRTRTAAHTAEADAHARGDGETLGKANPETNTPTTPRTTREGAKTNPDTNTPTVENKNRVTGKGHKAE